MAARSFQNLLTTNFGISPSGYTGSVGYTGSAGTGGGGNITSVSDQINDSTGYIAIPSGTTAQRPGSPPLGALRINTSTNVMEVFSSNTWFTVVSVQPNFEVEYAALAGGGGGGTNAGAGGGAGGYLTGSFTAYPSYSYTITIGGGGTGGSSDGNPAGTGGNTTIVGSGISAILCYGGGGGVTSGGTGGNGGSGGGGAAGGSGGKGVYPGSTYVNAPRQGYDGGSGNGYDGASRSGAGGGGAAGAGAGQGPGADGIGIANPFNESTAGQLSSGVYYLGGGGGGSPHSGTGGAGGLGGGGAGGTGNSSAGTVGTANTGGGGGAGGGYGYVGANGGSGVVIIRTPAGISATVTGSHTVINAPTKKIWTFTGSGTITF